MWSRLQTPVNNSILTNRHFQRAVCIFLVRIISQIEPSAAAGDWCYSGNCGPKTWEGICTTGKMQSPININPLKAKLYPKGNKIILNTNYNISKSFLLNNNGHTLELLIQEDRTSKCLLRGDGLPNGPHYLSQIHFHWGPNNRVGSEHRLAGYSFPLEMHMVHVPQANQTPIAVLAVFFYLAKKDNPVLQPIITNIPKVKAATEIPVLIESTQINLMSLLPNKMRMFRYMGSLTTPPCVENVIWTVFQEPCPISAKQLAAFRKLEDHDAKPLLRTFRPLQPTYTSTRKNVFFMRMLKE